MGTYKVSKFNYPTRKLYGVISISGRPTMVSTEVIYWYRLPKRFCEKYPPGSTQLSVVSNAIYAVAKKHAKYGRVELKINTQDWPESPTKTRRLELTLIIEGAPTETDWNTAKIIFQEIKKMLSC